MSDQTAYCTACGRRFLKEDLQALKWENPKGITNYHTDQLCEDCVRKMCEAVGLPYEAPDEMPEEVMAEEVCRGGSA